MLLLGPDEASFYRPASPISKKGIDPGVLWAAPSRVAEEADGPRLVEGPRVSAAEVGGKKVKQLVQQSFQFKLDR